MQQEFLTRRQLVEFLHQIGLPTGKGQLDKLVWRGEGPPSAGRWGNRDVFRPDDVRDWAMQRLHPDTAKTGRAAS
jgi:hypothetical protein